MCQALFSAYKRFCCLGIHGRGANPVELRGTDYAALLRGLHLQTGEQASQNKAPPVTHMLKSRTVPCFLQPEHFSTGNNASTDTADLFFKDSPTTL
jgi:hypothetical protein